MDEDKLTDFFIGKNKKKHYYLKLRNKHAKPIIFTDIIPDFNYDYLKGDLSNEVLKMEVLCSKPLVLIKKILDIYPTTLTRLNLWCLKKDYVQFIGLSFEEFLRFMNLRNFHFVYPIILDDYYIVFSGISGNARTYKIFVYFNNRRIPYIDMINSFKKEMKDSGFTIKMKRVRKIEVYPQRSSNLSTEVPQLKATWGFLRGEEYEQYYFFIKKLKTKTNTIADNLSHLLVWDNGISIKFNEREKFSFHTIRFLELEEFSIVALRADKDDKSKKSVKFS